MNCGERQTGMSHWEVSGGREQELRKIEVVRQCMISEGIRQTGKQCL